MSHLTFSAEIALFFGALHALEPGHGKTALMAYVASGKLSWAEGFTISLTSAITHSLVIFVIALLSHYALHHGATYSTIDMEHFLGFASGALIISLGTWIIFSKQLGKEHKSCGTCSHHKKSKEHQTIRKRDFLKSGILGLATGIIPCPTVLAVYLSGLTSGNSLIGIKSVGLFALGMFASLMLLILVCRFGGEKVLKKLSGSKLSLNWAYIQGFLLIAIGIFTTIYSFLGHDQIH